MGSRADEHGGVAPCAGPRSHAVVRLPVLLSSSDALVDGVQEVLLCILGHGEDVGTEPDHAVAVGFDGVDELKDSGKRSVGGLGWLRVFGFKLVALHPGVELLALVADHGEHGVSCMSFLVTAGDAWACWVLDS